MGKVTENEILYNLINLRQLVIEVTDSCNFRCSYCIFGELYQKTIRRNGNVKFAQIKPLLEHLTSIWAGRDVDRITDIGFYGGEPLLNMTLIREVINFLNENNTKKSFTYSMTTNGLLLNEHMDYLANKNFDLLISLDGDEYGQYYRLKKNGENSFNDVFKNIVLLKEKYPLYFKNKVNFHSVIHNRNSVRGVVEFVLKYFGKIPSLAEISPNGISKTKKALYSSMYQIISKSIQMDSSPEGLLTLLGEECPGKEYVYQYLKAYSGNIYESYNSLIAGQVSKSATTGTCHPFQMKLYVTVKGEILQCEQINREYVYGFVSEERLSLDCAEVAEKFNAMQDRVRERCKACSITTSCPVCMFYIEGFPINPRCKEFKTQELFKQYQKSCLNLLRNNPLLYSKLINETYSG